MHLHLDHNPVIEKPNHTSGIIVDTDSFLGHSNGVITPAQN